MEFYCQGWSNAWKPQETWTWALLGSLLVHGLLVAGLLTAFLGKPAPRTVVVPVEAIALVPMPSGSKGGSGGRPETVTRPQPVPPKPKPVIPPPKPRVRPKRPTKVKLPPPPLEPTRAPVIPTPAPPPAITRAKASPPAATISRANSSGASAGASGSGGRGTGVGTGVGPGRGRGSGSGSGTGSGSALQGYLWRIRQLLDKEKDYPLMARRRNIQGMVKVVFTIAAGGQVDASRVSRSSGHDLLDEAAWNTIRRVRRFPPLPASLKRQKLTVEVPLAFRLDE